MLLLSPEERASRYQKETERLKKDRINKYKIRTRERAVKGKDRNKVYSKKHHTMPECGVIFRWYTYTDHKKPRKGVHYMLQDGRSGDIDCTYANRKKRIYEVLASG